MGRPTDFTEEVASIICERVADGESLRKICADDDMPERRTVYNWLNRNGEFFHQYTRARELQADTFFDEIVEIADKAHPLHVVDDVQDRRLRIDTRKWAAGKLKGKYSDKVKHVGGDEDDNPIQVNGLDIRFI